MNIVSLKTKIPCENCSKSIRQTLTNVPGVLNVQCSIKDGEIRIEIENNLDNAEMKIKLIEEMEKTGRICT